VCVRARVCVCERDIGSRDFFCVCARARQKEREKEKDTGSGSVPCFLCVCAHEWEWDIGLDTFALEKTVAKTHMMP